MERTLSDAVKHCAFEAARYACADAIEHIGWALMVAARLHDSAVETLEQLDLLLDRQPQQGDDAEPAPDDDAARDRMERSFAPLTVMIDGNGTRWDVREQGTDPFLTRHKSHEWERRDNVDPDLVGRACRLCGMTMTKSLMQT